jgi:hypothetical protein
MSFLSVPGVLPEEGASQKDQLDRRAKGAFYNIHVNVNARQLSNL